MGAGGCLVQAQRPAALFGRQAWATISYKAHVKFRYAWGLWYLVEPRNTNIPGPVCTKTPGMYRHLMVASVPLLIKGCGNGAHALLCPGALVLYAGKNCAFTVAVLSAKVTKMNQEKPEMN